VYSIEDAFNSFSHKLDGKLLALPDGMSYDASHIGTRLGAFISRRILKHLGLYTLGTWPEPELNIGFNLPKDEYNSKEPPSPFPESLLHSRSCILRLKDCIPPQTF
jgi:hypothetical protein